MDAVEAGDASLKHSSSIWVAGWFQARLDDELFFPLPTGPHFSGELGGFCCRRVVFLAVISWRGGGRVRDPVEKAFQVRSGHIYKI